MYLLFCFSCDFKYTILTLNLSLGLYRKAIYPLQIAHCLIVVEWIFNDIQFLQSLFSPAASPPHLFLLSHPPPLPPSLPSLPLGYEPVIVISCLDLIFQEARRQGHNFEVEVQHKKDKVLQAFEDLHLTRQSIYFITNYHEGKRGGIRMWDKNDKGFDKATKKMVDLARDLLSVADRFIERKYTGNSSCSIL